MSRLFLREWTRAVQRANAKSLDLIEQLEAADGRKQRTIFGIRRLIRKMGVTDEIVSLDLEALNERALDQVRTELATQFRKQQQLEKTNP
jgi:hypothetical protein